MTANHPSRWLIAPALLAGLSIAGTGQAQVSGQAPAAAVAMDLAIPVDAGRLLNQHLFADGEAACGPAAVANCLRQGTPPMAAVWDNLVGGDDATRLRFLIDRWFRNRPSAAFPGKKRLSHDGVLEEDLADACREIWTEAGLPAPTGGYLDRRVGEKSPEFLARVHGLIAGSLRDGQAPILSLKTYIARRLKRMDDELAWELAQHHWVVVTGVRRELRPTDLGFALELIDPDGGRPSSAYVYAETRQDFNALKGTEARGHWLRGRPFLLVEAPGVLALRPKEADWPDRVIVVANFLLGSR